MLPCGFSDAGYFKPDGSGHRARRGAFIIQSHNHSPLCKSIRKHPSVIAVIRCARVPRVQTLGGERSQKGNPSPSSQRWGDIHGWMKQHKISPSINNHDWFQGHQLLQLRVRGGKAERHKPSDLELINHFWKMPFLCSQKDKRSNISTLGSTSQENTARCRMGWASIAVFFILSKELHYTANTLVHPGVLELLPICKILCSPGLQRLKDIWN